MSLTSDDLQMKQQIDMNVSMAAAKLCNNILSNNSNCAL